MAAAAETASSNIGALAQQTLAGLAELKEESALKTTWSREGCAERLRTFANRVWLGDDAVSPEECARYGWRQTPGEDWYLYCDQCKVRGTTSRSPHAKHCVWHGSPQPFSIWLFNVFDDDDSDNDDGDCDLCLMRRGHRRYCPLFLRRSSETAPPATTKRSKKFQSQSSSARELRASIASLLEEDY